MTLKVREAIKEESTTKSISEYNQSAGQSGRHNRELSLLNRIIMASTSNLSLAHSDKKAKIPPGNETILLVEDDSEVREVIRRVLQRQGYRLLEAPNGREALDLAAYHSGPIDLLLTDVILPGMSGKELALKMAQRRPELKILFISGYMDETIAHHGVLEPEVAFLKKPFEPATLARKVRAVLDG